MKIIPQLFKKKETVVVVLSLQFNAHSNKEVNNTTSSVLRKFRISFSPDTYHTKFFQKGQTTAMILNSEIGKPTHIVSHQKLPYLFFDARTQKIKWNKDLPLGETTLKVIATKGDRTAETELTFINHFSGIFKGGLNITDEKTSVLDIFKVSFNKDGTLMFFNGSRHFKGTYKINSNYQIMMKVEDYDGVFVLYKGQLVYTDTQKPIISGNWYFETINKANRQGYFKFEWAGRCVKRIMREAHR